MMLKTVYGPPPADEERIECSDLEADSDLIEDAGLAEKPSANTSSRTRKGAGDQ